jgi:hypothetical protein
MKKYLLIFLLLANIAVAGINVRLTWDAPLATDPVPEGYSLYKKSGTGTTAIWTLVRRYTLAQVGPARFMDLTTDGGGTYAITAYNAGGESDRSAEVTIPGKPGVPVAVRIQIEFTP